MFIRFKEAVEIGLRRFKAGDSAEIDDNTARTLVDLRVAVVPVVLSSGPVPPMSDEEHAALAKAMELVKTPRPAAPASRVSGEGDTLPAPTTKKKGGLFRRTGS